MKGKPKVTRMRKHTLHQPPPDVAEASKHPLLDPYDPKSWVRYSDYLDFMRGRNMKMPAHQPARPSCLYTDQNGAKYYETDEEFAARKFRLANRKAGKKFL